MAPIYLEMSWHHMGHDSSEQHHHMGFSLSPAGDTQWVYSLVSGLVRFSGLSEREVPSGHTALG